MGEGVSKTTKKILTSFMEGPSLCSYHRCCRRTLDFSRFCHSWHTLGSLHKLTPREIEANGRKVAVNGHHVEVSISCKYCRNKATITLYLLTYLLAGTKGQLISKAIHGLLISPKKRMDEFVLFALLLFTANKSNSSVYFL